MNTERLEKMTEKTLADIVRFKLREVEKCIENYEKEGGNPFTGLEYGLRRLWLIDMYHAFYGIEKKMRD